MDKSTETKKLLEIYYKGFAEKENWESVIADVSLHRWRHYTGNIDWKTGIY